jgi:membrane fusion protein, multidrug efflux system
MTTMNAVTDKAKLAEPQPTEQPAPQVKTGGSTRKKLLRGAALLVVIAGAAATAHWWFSEGAFIATTDNAYLQSDIAVLGPRIDGIVASVNVADNQPVKAGDVLWTLDPADRQAQLDQARAALAEATQAVAVARLQIGQQQAAIDSAEAAIASAQAEQARATADAQRSQSLVGAGWTSRQADDLARTERLKSDAALAIAQAQRNAAQQALAVGKANVTQAEARVATATAQVHIAEVNLGYTVTRAPADGVVGNKAIRVGAYVAPGQQLLAFAPKTLFVVANYKETQLAHMKPGQDVELTADIDPDHPVHAKLDSLAPATGALFSLLPPENATGNFTKVVQRVPVKIVIPAEEAAKAPWLRAGLSVTAEVDTRDGHPKRLGLLGSLRQWVGLN